MSPSTDKHAMVHNRLNKSRHANNLPENPNHLFLDLIYFIEESVNLGGSKDIFSGWRSFEIFSKGNFLSVLKLKELIAG